MNTQSRVANILPRRELFWTFWGLKEGAFCIHEALHIFLHDVGDICFTALYQILIDGLIFRVAKASSTIGFTKHFFA